MLEEYLGAVEEATRRVQRLDEQIAMLVPNWSMAPVVKAFMAFRGVSLLAATTVAAELGDLTRFDQARQLMGFVGLVPSLRASGPTHRAGSITKTGNGHARRMLTESAWAYRLPARRTYHLRCRMKGQPEEVLELSWKAQLRLCRQFRKMRGRGKPQNVIVTAIARELLGFLWATARLVTPRTIPSVH